MPGIQTLIGRFVDDCTSQGRSQKTIHDYRATLNRFARWLDAQDLKPTPGTIRAYFHDLQDGTRSPETVRTYARTLRVFFGWCKRHGHTRKNLARAVPMARKPTRRPKAASPDALARLLASCDDSAEGRRDRALLLLLADTGARAAELCGLRLDDLATDLHGATVTGKGQKDRALYFHPVTQATLKAWLDVKPASPYLFPSRCGHLLPNGLGQMLKRRATAAGIEGPINPHSWRHFFALSYLKNGADIASLATLLGHADLQVTREYLRWTATDLEERHTRYSPLNHLE